MIEFDKHQISEDVDNNSRAIFLLPLSVCCVCDWTRLDSEVEGGGGGGGGDNCGVLKGLRRGNQGVPPLVSLICVH